MLKTNDFTPSAELGTLIQLLKNKQLSVNSINSEHLLQLIADHRIHGPIAHSKHFNENKFEDIRSSCFNNKMTQLTLSSALEDVGTILKDIKWIGLKGPILSQYLYNDSAERTSKDLDILIAESELDLVLQRFIKSGYRILTYWNSPKQKEALIRYYHHLELLHPNEKIVIELHWKLFKYSQIEFSFDEEIQRVNIGDNNYAIFQNETLLYYLSIHGLQHGFFRLQWLHDVYRLSSLNKELFAQTIAKYGDNKYAYRSLIATAKLLEIVFDHHIDYLKEQSVDRSTTRLVNYCIHAILQNDSYASNKEYNSFFRVHYLNYLIGGSTLLIKGLFYRNVRPQNWKLFAFPDTVFFLNHLFSRIISLFNKLKK